MQHANCTVCGELAASKRLAALEHDLEHHDGKAPTCTEVGWNEYNTCSVCNKVFKDSLGIIETTVSNEYLEALGHDLVHHEANDPTCTETGNYEYYECSRCHETFKDSLNQVKTTVEEETISVLGHDIVHHEAKAATCTEVGWIEYDTCSRCDYTTYNEIAKIPHTLSEWIVDLKPTCLVEGSQHKECTVCHEKLETESINVLGHDLVHHEAKTPTCTEVGGNEYDTCSRCDYTTYVELPALGHKASEWIVDLKPTCLVEGSQHKECTVCHEKLETESIKALGHDLVHHEAKEPTCTEISWNEYDTCSRCDYTTYVELPANGHTMIKTDRVEPTCLTSGNNEYYTCSVCNKVYKDSLGQTETTVSNEYLEALGHSLEKVEAHDPQCLLTGNHEYYECSRCHETFKDSMNQVKTTVEEETISALGHAEFEFGLCTRCNGPDHDSEGFVFQEFRDDNYELYGYKVIDIGTAKNYENLVIPAYYNGFPVLEIQSCYSVDSKVKTIFIPDTVEKINDLAFQFNQNLERVNISNDSRLKTIGRGIFHDCYKICSFTIPKSVVDVNKDIFTISSVVEVINKSETYTFSSEFFEQNPNISVITNELDSKIVYDGDYIYYIDGDMKKILLYTGSEENIVIPEGTTIINEKAFSDNQIIKSVEFPSSLQIIDHSAFRNASNLTTVIFNNGLKQILNEAFAKTNIKEINLPSSLEVLADIVFSNCLELETVNFAPGIKITSLDAFYNNHKLTSLVIPKSITSIAYIPTTITTLTFEEGFELTTIEAHLFSMSQLQSITIPDSVEIIEGQAFANSALVELLFTENSKLKEIGNMAFGECNNLVKVVLPASLTTIASDAFLSESVNILEIINHSSLDIKAGSEDNGSVALNAKNIITDEADSKVTIDENGYVIYDNTILTGYIGTNKDVVIPTGIKTIYNNAFYYREDIETVVIPEGVETIGWMAFSGMSCLYRITLPSTLTSIGESVFRNCFSLVEVINKSSLNITFGYSNTDNVSNNSKVIKNTEFESKVYRTDDGFLIYQVNETESVLLKYDGEVTEIVLPNVTAINYQAFIKIIGISKITIPKTVTKLYYHSLTIKYLAGLTKTNISYLGTKEEWNNIEKASSISMGQYIVECTDGTIE